MILRIAQQYIIHVLTLCGSFSLLEFLTGFLQMCIRDSIILLPVFQLDDQIDLLLLLDALDTEQRLHINDADSAQLDKITCDIR